MMIKINSSILGFINRYCSMLSLIFFAIYNALLQNWRKLHE